MIFAGRAFHQQGRAFRVQLVKRLAELFALRFLHLEAFHYHQLAIGQLGRQRRAQRAQQLLARKSVIVRAGLGSVDRAAVPPQRRANGTHARASGALLLPQLLTRAAHHNRSSFTAPNTSSASSKEPTFSPPRFTTSIVAIVSSVSICQWPVAIFSSPRRAWKPSTDLPYRPR